MKLICSDTSNTYEFTISSDEDADIFNKISAAKEKNRIRMAFTEIKKRLGENIPNKMYPMELIQ